MNDNFLSHYIPYLYYIILLLFSIYYYWRPSMKPKSSYIRSSPVYIRSIYIYYNIILSVASVISAATAFCLHIIIIIVLLVQRFFDFRWRFCRFLYNMYPERIYSVYARLKFRKISISGSLWVARVVFFRS